MARVRTEFIVNLDNSGRPKLDSKPNLASVTCCLFTFTFEVNSDFEIEFITEY